MKERRGGGGWWWQRKRHDDFARATVSGPVPESRLLSRGCGSGPEPAEILNMEAGKERAAVRAGSGNLPPWSQLPGPQGQKGGNPAERDAPSPQSSRKAPTAAEREVKTNHVLVPTKGSLVDLQARKLRCVPLGIPLILRKEGPGAERPPPQPPGMCLLRTRSWSLMCGGWDAPRHPSAATTDLVLLLPPVPSVDSSVKARPSQSSLCSESSWDH